MVRTSQARRAFSWSKTRPDQAGPGTGPGGIVRTSQAKLAFSLTRTRPDQAGPGRTRCRTRRGFRGSSKRKPHFLYTEQGRTRPDQAGPGAGPGVDSEEASGETNVFFKHHQAGPGRTRHRTRRNGEDVSGETCVFGRRTLSLIKF